jgi:hypothetical protein
MADITAEYVRTMLSYNPETGVFTWRVKPNRRIRVNSVAGSISDTGYRTIRLKRRPYKANRLAWLYMTGAHPKQVIDHIDGNPLNNAFNNLRDVTIAQNVQNQKRAHVRNKHGFLGVSWHIAGKCWRARICVDGKHILLGYFKTPEEAHNAYLQAKRKYHLTCTI